jgi:carbonic anhydrase
MPYKLRKAPNRDLYWVVTIETKKKHSKEPIPIEKAKAQMRILESALHGGVKLHGGSCKPPYHEYSKGKASVFVLTCIDPRYTFDVAFYLQHKKELHQNYDLFTLAGASVGATKKEWTKSFNDNLDLGMKLHGITEVWCFDHLDCGMYKATFGLEKDLDPKIHIQCMNKLKALIKKKHPKLKFREFMVDAHGHVSFV